VANSLRFSFKGRVGFIVWLDASKGLDVGVASKSIEQFRLQEELAQQKRKQQVRTGKVR
jgi:hypothetical protein